jgi:hypothetical protein
LEQFLVVESADGAVLAIGPQHPFAKGLLMDSLPYEAGHVPTADVTFKRVRVV